MKTDLVVGGYLIHEDRVLLVHHKKSGLWLPVGGHIDENETPDDALVREFKEETKLDIKILGLLDVTTKGTVIRQLAVPFYVNVHNVGDHEHCCFFYLCETKDAKIEIDRDELHDFAWFTKEELNQDHVPGDVKDTALLAFESYGKLKN